MRLENSFVYYGQLKFYSLISMDVTLYCSSPHSTDDFCKSAHLRPQRKIREIMAAGRGEGREGEEGGGGRG